MAKNVLLIGATGFVGSAILNELVNRGHKVTAVVHNVEKVAKNDLVEAVAPINKTFFAIILIRLNCY